MKENKSITLISEKGKTPTWKHLIPQPEQRILLAWRWVELEKEGSKSLGFPENS